MRLVLIALVLSVCFVLAESGTPRQTRAAPDWGDEPPVSWILGPIQGADGREQAIMDNLDAIDEWDLPVTAFHFDARTWQTCAGNGEFRYSNRVIKRMNALGIRGIFWTVPLIALRCPEYHVALANNYFVTDGEGNVIITDDFTGNGSWIDFNNPDAVAYYRSLLDRLRNRVGGMLGGFYTDNVRPDDRYGQVAYAEQYALELLNYQRAHIPDGVVIFKRYGKNTPSDEFLAEYADVAYVNDLSTDFEGMREGIRRVFDSASLMPLPFNEFSGFATSSPDAETYIRRMHFGAFQPVMENVPKGAQPWDARYPSRVMEAYRYYATLHRELAPYLYSYQQEAYETQAPIFRNMNPANYSAQLGNEIFVRYVTDYHKSIRVKLPPGEWINYWDEAQTFAGDRAITYPVPLGREPIFILRGAIVPMHVRNNVTGHGTNASRKFLTVNVYPNAHSTFRYYDAANGWLTFDVTSEQRRVTLCTLDQVPSQPLLYRIARVQKRPNVVRTLDGAVGVNAEWGAPLREYASEEQAARANGGWFYDANAKRLIVKLTALGTNCPAPSE